LLGHENRENCLAFIDHLKHGRVQQLGELMTTSQKQFDEAAAPLCPEELTAPKLHAVLRCPAIQGLIYGGKGMGSQGDGSAQLLCKGRQDMDEVVRVLEKAMDVRCIKLTLQKTD
jgi:galactokinase